MAVTQRSFDGTRSTGTSNGYSRRNNVACQCREQQKASFERESDTTNFQCFPKSWKLRNWKFHHARLFHEQITYLLVMKHLLCQLMFYDFKLEFLITDYVEQDVVKSSFGILKNKSRILHRPLNVNIDFAKTIIEACRVLHIWVIEIDFSIMTPYQLNSWTILKHKDAANEQEGHLINIELDGKLFY